MVDLRFVRAHARLFAAGMLLTFSSTFGQTYFIALFAGHFRSEFDLSHGEYGGLYMIGTLASAATLIYAGTLADRIGPAKLGAMTLFCLGLVCVLVALTPSWIVLLLAFYGLRLFGQGMTTHISITAMARWFDAHRGRAISIAMMGHSFAEAFLPILAVGSVALFGWRVTWGIGAVYLIAVAIPLLLWLLKDAPQGALEPGSERSRNRAEIRQWSRKEVLADPLFYAVLVGFLAPAFIGTGIFFHQVHLVDVKGWSLAGFAAGFPIFAGAAVVSSLVTGWATDKWGAWRLLPGYLVPLVVGLMALSFGYDPMWIFVYMVCGGITMGLNIAFLGVLWVEMYGQKFLGSIRSLALSGMVFASALSPFVMGLLIDIGVGIETQMIWMAVYSALTVPFYLSLSPAFNRREAA